MKATLETVTNEEILKAVRETGQNQTDLMQNFQEMMQMTSEGLDKLDKNMDATNEQLDGVESETRLLKGEVKNLENPSYRHELQLAEFTRTQDRLNGLIHIDVKKIPTRPDVIEARLPEIFKEEIRQLQAELQQAVDWIAKVSKLKNIPVKFPS